MKLSDEEFEKLVYQALEEVPRRFKERMENIDIAIEDSPSRSLLEEMGIRPPGTLFGLYQGVPLKERGHWYGNVLPDKITLYKKPLEQFSRTAEGLKQNVVKTVIHEIAHYFGFDDEELEELE